MSSYEDMTRGLNAARLEGTRWVPARRRPWVTIPGVLVTLAAAIALGALLALRV